MNRKYTTTTVFVASDGSYHKTPQAVDQHESYLTYCKVKHNVIQVVKSEGNLFRLATEATSELSDTKYADVVDFVIQNWEPLENEFEQLKKIINIKKQEF